MSALPFDIDAGGVRLRVRLTPRGGRDALEGIELRSDGSAVLKARVRAAPEKGAANEALEGLIAKSLGVPKTAVSVTAGAKSRVKTVRVSGDARRLGEAAEALARG